MCNFAGKGRDATVKDVNEAMDFIIDHNNKCFQEDSNRGHAIININALGSFFHSGELNKEVRSQIYKRIRDYAEGEAKGKNVVFINESRIDHITEEKMKEMREGVGDNVIIDIGVGIESTDDLVRESIINKGLPEDWKERLEIVRKYDGGLTAHIMYGTPVLNEKQQITDAIKSFKECAEMTDSEGKKMFDTLLFMVMNSKPGTLVNYLKEQGVEDLPNILSAVEGIIKIGDKISKSDLEKSHVFGLVGPNEFSE